MSHSVEQVWSPAAVRRGSAQGGPIGHCPRSWLGSLRSPPLYFPQTTPDAPARTGRGAGAPLQRKADSSTAARRTVRQPGEEACSTEIKRSEPKASEPFGRTGLESGCRAPGVSSHGGPIGHCSRSWRGGAALASALLPSNNARRARPDSPDRKAPGTAALLRLSGQPFSQVSGAACGSRRRRGSSRR